jgi:hypothetical protein
MFDALKPPRPTPRIAHTVWLCGVVAAFVLWALIVAAVGPASGRPLALAYAFNILAPFVRFVAGWTGAWLSTRNRNRATVGPTAP